MPLQLDIMKRENRLPQPSLLRNVSSPLTARRPQCCRDIAAFFYPQCLLTANSKATTRFSGTLRHPSPQCLLTLTPGFRNVPDAPLTVIPHVRERDLTIRSNKSLEISPSDSKVFDNPLVEYCYYWPLFTSVEMTTVGWLLLWDYRLWAMDCITTASFSAMSPHP